MIAARRGCWGSAVLWHYAYVSSHGMIWRPAPGWPETPAGWVPPIGWQPPADWPPAPDDWVFWVPLEPRKPTPIVPTELTRSSLIWETRFVVFGAFFPAVVSAVIILVVHLATNAKLVQLPTLTPHQPVLNVILGLLSYMPVAAVVPVALLLLARTGQPPAGLGLTRMSWPDFGAILGLVGAGILGSFLFTIPLIPLEHTRLMNTAGHLNLPAYYIILGVSQSLITAIAEEVVVNGYLVTRLDQLGWSQDKALWTSMAVRMSYHVYYGVGFVTLLPVNYFLTRSFQKNGKLNRPILAHFLYDAILITVAILAGSHH
jgi:hypothetical protein